MDYKSNINSTFKDKYLKQSIIDTSTLETVDVLRKQIGCSLESELNLQKIDTAKLNDLNQQYLDVIISTMEKKWEVVADSILALTTNQLVLKRETKHDLLAIAVSNLSEMRQLRLDNLANPEALHIKTIRERHHSEVAAQTEKFNLQLSQIEDNRQSKLGEANRDKQKRINQLRESQISRDLQVMEAECSEMEEQHRFDRETLKVVMKQTYDTSILELQQNGEEIDSEKLAEFEAKWKHIWQSTFNEVSSKQNKELGVLTKKIKTSSNLISSKTYHLQNEFETAQKNINKLAQNESDKVKKAKQLIIDQAQLNLDKQIKSIRLLYNPPNTTTPPQPSLNESQGVIDVSTSTSTSSTKIQTTQQPTLKHEKKEIVNNNNNNSNNNNNNVKQKKTNVKTESVKIENNNINNTKKIEYTKTEVNSIVITNSNNNNNNNTTQQTIKLNDYILNAAQKQVNSLANIKKSLNEVKNSIHTAANGTTYHKSKLTQLSIDNPRLAKVLKKLYNRKRKLEKKVTAGNEQCDYLSYLLNRSLEPLATPSADNLKLLNKDCYHLFDTIGCKNKSRGASVILKVGNLLAKPFIGFDPKLYLFGSSSNGLAFNTSDLDISLVTNKPLDQGKAANKIANILRKNHFKDVHPITRTRVPIVKFKDAETNISCDISVNNPLAIYNSKMIYDYCSLDERIRPMAIVIKKWSKVRGINDASQNSLHSYSYANMIIHFLQLEKIKILPCLQKLANGEYQYSKGKSVGDGKYIPDFMVEGKNVKYYSNIESLKKYSSGNTMSVGELVLEFFKYYAIEFNYNHTISIRTGGIIEDKRWDNQSKPYYIKIEDPFDIGFNMARSVRKVIHLSIILKEFHRAYQILSNGGSLNELIQELDKKRKFYDDDDDDILDVTYKDEDEDEDDDDDDDDEEDEEDDGEDSDSEDPTKDIEHF